MKQALKRAAEDSPTWWPIAAKMAAEFRQRHRRLVVVRSWRHESRRVVA